MASPLEDPRFSEQDVVEHSETYGLDLLPPFDLRMESTRAHTLFTALNARWPTVYNNLMIGQEFVITATLEFEGGEKAQYPTLIVNNRGPIFQFPHKVGAVRGQTPINFASLESPAELFREAFAIFLKTFPTRQTLRLGVVRNLVFALGKTDCNKWLGRGFLQFDSSNLYGVQAILAYKDEFFDYRLQLATAQIIQTTAVPALPSQVLSEPIHSGLVVSLDVHNLNAKLDDDELQSVIEKAKSLWPDILLNFLNSRRWPDEFHPEAD
jgi:hypothetical protein